MMTTSTRQLIIFLKAPEISRCKTRLIPLLGEQGATEFYIDLATHCVKNLHSLSNIDVTLFCYPDIHHDFLHQLSKTYHVGLQAQQGHDLGERMFNAIECALYQHEQCVLIGSDCPSLTPEYIEQAFSALNSHDIALGPVTDGGYILIGARKIDPEIFANTQWSTHSVLQQCLQNIEKLKYSHYLLPTLWDIDTPNDFIENQSQIQTLLNKQYHTGH